MPIVVVCPCGAKLKAPDAAAGKRVKCPKCASALLVPAPEADYVEVEDDPSPAPTPAKRKPQLIEDDEDAPRPTKKATAARSKPAPVEVDEPVDDEDEEEERPQRKTPGKKKKGMTREALKKKRLLTLILGLCGATFVLGAAGVVLAIALNTQDPAKAGLSTQPAVPQPPPLPAGWSTFKGEGFSVAVPDAAQFKKQDQQGPNAGGPQPPQDTKVYANGVQPQPQPNGPPIFIYVVSVGKLPPGAAAEFAKSPEAGWEAIKKANAGGAKLENEKVIQVGGVEGRQYTASTGFVAGIVRVVVKGEKVYSWLVMSQAAPAADAPEVKPFFDTFKLD